MKITINKKANSAEQVIKDIIRMAKQTAEQGNKFFTYDYGSRENRSNIETGVKTSINTEVIKRTEGTVEVCYGGDSWSSTKFYIKDN